MCKPFWEMPSSDQGTYLTYPNGNTHIIGDISRSVCASFRADKSNDNNIIFSIGSFDTTWNGKGCNTHFALAIQNATHVNVFGMCHIYDNQDIPIGQGTLYDGKFHQICLTYNNIDSKLCIYHNLQSPECLIRKNHPYNTTMGDVRIGWWTDNNRQYVAAGGRTIRSVSLFDKVITQNCVADQLMVNS